jgi:hypothetical protein
MKLNFLLLFLIGILSFACSLDKVPKIDSLSNFFSNDINERNIRPEDSIKYNCDKKKTFFLLYLKEKKSVWVILPDREFRLNQIDETQDIYTNNITTLAISPGQTQIENEKEILYSQCVEENEKKDAP